MPVYSVNGPLRLLWFGMLLAGKRLHQRAGIAGTLDIAVVSRWFVLPYWCLYSWRAVLGLTLDCGQLLLRCCLHWPHGPKDFMATAWNNTRRFLRHDHCPFGHCYLWRITLTRVQCWKRCSHGPSDTIDMSGYILSSRCQTTHGPNYVANRHL